MAKKRTKSNSNGASRRKLTKEVVTSRKEYQLGARGRGPHGYGKALEHYLKTALWSSTDDDGEPLDKNYSASDFAPSAVSSAREDLDAFMEQADPFIDATDLSSEDAAHNFWLTRNRHGAGFWDLGLGEIGKKLTDISHDFGESNVYLGDDGQLYFS